MKRLFFIMLFMVLLTGVCFASPTFVGLQDTLLSSANLKNSGDVTELDFITKFLNVDDDYFTLTKDEDMTSWIKGNNGTFAFNFKGHRPDLFLIKTGKIPGNQNRHFLYKNEELLDYAVINLFDISLEENIDIDNISHISYLLQGSIMSQSSETPEPSTLILFGFGLLVISGVSRRSKQ